MLRDFKIKKHTKYEIISFISLMISYAVGTFFSKDQRFDILVMLGSFGLLVVSIVSYILSIKNNPNKINVFHSKKGKILFVLGCSVAIILLMILMYEHKWLTDVKVYFNLYSLNSFIKWYCFRYDVIFIVPKVCKVQFLTHITKICHTESLTI